MAVTSTPPNVYVHDDGRRIPRFGVSPDASWTLPTSAPTMPATAKLLGSLWTELLAEGLPRELAEGAFFRACDKLMADTITIKPVTE